MPGLKTWFEDFPRIQTNVSTRGEGKAAVFSNLIFSAIFPWPFYVSNSTSSR